MTAVELDAALRGLPGWVLRDGALRRAFAFADFADAFAWMASIALECEKLDHHPDWRNVYNRVEVALSTHDPRGITELDLTLARRMDKTASRLGGEARPIS